MKKTDNRQAGFGLVGVLVVVLVVVMIGATSWGVYQHNRQKLSKAADGQTNNNQQTNAKSSGNTQTTSTNQNAKTFVIPELGAKIMLPDGLTATDLQYSINTTTGVPVANFTTTNLEQMDGTGSCSAAQAPIGVIWRAIQNPASGSVTVKQIGQYYYAFEKPQGSCTGNLNAGKLEQSQTVLLQQAFATITAIN